METFRPAAVGIGLIAAVLLSGCAAFLLGAGAGAGAVAYYQGEFQAINETTLERAHQASIQSLESMEFEIVDQQKDSISGRVEARTADDRDITVRTKRLEDDPDLIRFRIRVGTFGDEELSRSIHDEIEQRL